MALRLLLVGVVASLALDLPDRGATQSNGRSGQSWLDARVVGPNSPEGFVAIAVPTADVPEVPSLPPTLIVADLAPTATEVVAPIAPIVVEIVASPGVSASLILPGRLEAAFVATVEPLILDIEPSPASLPVIADLAPIADVVVANEPAVEAEPAAQITVEENTTPSEGILADIAPVTIAEPIVVIEDVLKAVPADPDAAFQSVVGEMAHAFAADVPARVESAPLIAAEPIAAPPAPEAEQVVVVGDQILPVDADEAAPTLADLLNREAEGLMPIPMPEAAAIAEVPADPVDPPTQETRGNRLAHAVQLTGQAMQAWASLLVQRPAVISVQR